MAILPQAVERLAQMGANIEITAKTEYLPQAVEKIVQAAAGKGAHVTIDAANYPPQALESFVQIGGKNVTIRI